MAKILRIVGHIEDTGSVACEPNQGQYTSYSHITFSSTEGEICLKRVFVPSRLDPFVLTGRGGEFYVVTAKYPKLFGSIDVSFLYAVTTKEKSRQAIEEVRQCLSGSKGAALSYLFYGLVLLPAFGVGVLFWIMALRLLSITFPEREMKASFMSKRENSFPAQSSSSTMTSSKPR